MRRVDTDTQWQLWTGLDDCPQVFEAMADTFSLAGGVLQQNPEASELQTLAGHLQTECADLQSIPLATAASAARMDHQIISAEQDGALHLFPKRLDRFQQQQF